MLFETFDFDSAISGSAPLRLDGRGPAHPLAIPRTGGSGAPFAEEFLRRGVEAKSHLCWAVSAQSAAYLLCKKSKKCAILRKVNESVL